METTVHWTSVLMCTCDLNSDINRHHSENPTARKIMICRWNYSRWHLITFWRRRKKKKHPKNTLTLHSASIWLKTVFHIVHSYVHEEFVPHSTLLLDPFFADHMESGLSPDSSRSAPEQASPTVASSPGRPGSNAKPILPPIPLGRKAAESGSKQQLTGQAGQADEG